MQARAVLAAVFSMLMAASAAQAQVYPGGGGFPGGRDGMGGRMGQGIRRWRPPVDIPDLGNPIRRYILQNRAELRLTDAQASRVDSVAAALDGRNDTLIAAVKRALDMDSTSVANRDRGGRAGRDAAGREDGGASDDIRLRDRMNALKPTVKEIKANDEAAWATATALLEKDQRKQADKLRKDDEKAQERARNRWRGGGVTPGGIGGPDD